MAYVISIFSGLYQADTGAFAAFDLVLQAGPCAILVETVLALAHQKSFLQQVEAFANGTCAGIRAEVPAFLLFRAAVNTQAREVAVGKQHIGIGLIIAQQNIVRRAPFFDQRLLKQQGFGFVGGDGGFDLSDSTDQRGGLWR